MKKYWTALLLAGVMAMTGCGSSEPASETKEQPETPAAETTETKETEETGSREELTGTPITADENGMAEGFVGDLFSNAFFDYKVNDVQTVDAYEGYTPAEGNKLIVVDLTIKNTFRGSTPMFASDFYIVYDWTSENVQYADPINAEDDSKTLAGMLPMEYTLKINETRNGVSVYEIPAESKDVTLCFDEYFENGETGASYYVDFTVD